MRQTSVPFYFTSPPMLHWTAHRTTKQQGPHPTPYLPIHTMLGDKLRKNICIYLLLAVALSRQTWIAQFAPQLPKTCFACLHLLYCISQYPYMANCYCCTIGFASGSVDLQKSNDHHYCHPGGSCFLLLCCCTCKVWQPLFCLPADNSTCLGDILHLLVF